MTKKARKELLISVTKLFFKHLTEKSREDWINFPINISEENYDEYNGAYNDFKVAEIPDYLFGIWWDLETHIEEKYNFETRKRHKESVEYIVGSFFGDYEREIDKFKPWRCYFKVCLYIKVDNLKKLINGEINYFPLEDYYIGAGSLSDIIDKFKFIYTEPELAFCQCWCDWDYNEKHHTRANAKKEYKKYIEYKKQKQNEQNDALKEQFNYFKLLLDSYGLVQDKDYVVVSREMISPEYEVIIKVQDSWKQYLPENNSYGYYGTFYLGDILANNNREVNKLANNYKKFQNKTRKKYKYVYFLDDIDFFCVIATPKRFSKIKKEMNIVDISTPEMYYDKEVFEYGN